MSPTAVSASSPIADLTSTLKSQASALMNGKSNRASAEASTSIIDPEVLKRPNLALWVKKEHE